MVERGGMLRILMIPDRKKQTIHDCIRRNIEEGSVIYTDGWYSYKGLKSEYNHDFVNHHKREYAKGVVHTNTIENVWGLLKKSIRNAHHHISEKHLEKYCDEVAYRYNTRSMNTIDRFDDILKRCLTFHSQPI